jgi:hypothetical protein
VRLSSRCEPLLLTSSKSRGTPMTQFTAINRFAVAAFWARGVDTFRNDVIRRSERLIETCSDLQVVSHSALSLLRAHLGLIQSVRHVLNSLDSLKKVMERLYGGVTDIFHDNLIDAFSRVLYKTVHRMLVEFK